MKGLPVDPEEMAKRRDADFRAVMDMIGEGAPVFGAYDDEDVPGSKEDARQLPETYQ